MTRRKEASSNCVIIRVVPGIIIVPITMPNKRFLPGNRKRAIQKAKDVDIAAASIIVDTDTMTLFIKLI